MPKDNERFRKAETHQHPLDAGPAEGVVDGGRLGEKGGSAGRLAPLLLRTW